jgi:DNA replication protein DnaC
MKLFGMAHAIKERLERRDHQSLSKSEFVGLLVDDEWLYRENRKLTARLKVAKFKQRSAALENLDYATPRRAACARTRSWSSRRTAGSAHTRACSSWGLQAQARAFSHRPSAITPVAVASPFSTLRLPTLLSQFVQARAQGIYDRLLKRLAKTAVLIIDDFGLASLTDREKQDLLEAIEERHGSGATIVTAQLPVSDWHEYLGGGRIADAILDRLVHTAHRIELSSAESMRKTRPALNQGGHSDS